MNTLFFQLLFAHLTADFLLQSEKMAVEKAEYYFSSAFWKHIVIHGLCYFVVFAFHYHLIGHWEASGLSQTGVATLSLTSLHGLVDIAKTYFSKKFPGKGVLLFTSDQLIHIGILALFSINFDWNFLFAKIYNVEIPWKIIVAYLFVTTPAGIIMKVLLKRWTPESSQIIQDAYDNLMEVEIDLNRNDPKRLEKKFKFQKNTKFQNDRSTYASLQDAGQWIGILERILILTFVLNGDLKSIGFLLTAKSVFRFGDLKGGKDRQMTEYILIGTLISFGLAIFAGLMCLTSEEAKSLF
ncbi:DUF3307 domain-containing protein [Flammeovirga agarivorans]|uniref:DUF3307 domain-containing protein n=1 Tax=Flammeovirga agarivorans TaxID=2726742 RepID=A0A7X8SNN5_9BACT|nr:DUF3307 domain-containing protein [Flammeovirga agarivorans]NLR93576.1 DUF3307 domain-containing protein [Flammeovirga agarivorans]